MDGRRDRGGVRTGRSPSPRGGRPGLPMSAGRWLSFFWPRWARSGCGGAAGRLRGWTRDWRPAPADGLPSAAPPVAQCVLGPSGRARILTLVCVCGCLCGWGRVKAVKEGCSGAFLCVYAGSLLSRARATVGHWRASRRVWLGGGFSPARAVARARERRSRCATLGGTQGPRTAV